MAQNKGKAKPYSRQTIRLDKLLMDTENPRHDPINNEPEIIAWLLRKERVLALAQKIVELGDLNPLESVGVFPHPTKKGYFVVAEGNRRVCALTLLKDPARAPTAALKSRFKAMKAAAVQPLPDEIEVAKFDSEEAALPWKTLRHSGEQDGAGTRKWNAASIARNQKKVGASNANHAAVELLDYAEQSGLIDAKQRESIPLTTITRHITNPLLRNALGLASPASSFRLQAPQEEANRALAVFLKDALPLKGGEPPVNSRNKKPAIDAYARGLQTNGHAVKRRLKVAVVPIAKTPKRARNNKSPNDRSRVIPREFAVVIKSKTLKRLYDELRAIPIDGDPCFPFAANYLLRALIELLVKEYAGAKGLNQSGDMHVVADRCIAHMQADKSLQSKVGGEAKLKNQLKSWRVLSSKEDSYLSPATMGAAVHGNHVPTKSELIARWDNLEVGTGYLLAGLK